ncbi:MAG: DUF5658 family protein [Pseudomonadota bacterium]
MHTRISATRHRAQERRAAPAERRRKYARTLWAAVLSRRRAKVRRDADPRHNILVDHHEPLFFALIVTTILLCVADAFMTLIILGRGGAELNPVMRVLLETDVRVFFAVKYVLTAVCLVVALLHKRFLVFRYFNGAHVLWGTFAFYLLLINYEIMLLI